MITLIAAATRIKQRKAEIMAKAVHSVSLIDPVKYEAKAIKKSINPEVVTRYTNRGRL